MAGTSDLIAQGFGSWSTVNKIPTLGFSIATPNPPLDGVIEWTLTNTRAECPLKELSDDNHREGDGEEIAGRRSGCRG